MSAAREDLTLKEGTIEDLEMMFLSNDHYYQNYRNEFERDEELSDYLRRKYTSYWELPEGVEQFDSNYLKSNEFISKTTPLHGAPDPRVIINTSDATEILRMSFLYSKYLLAFDGPEVLTVDYFAFGHCASLVSVNLPMVKVIDEAAFSGCKALVSVNMQKLEEIGLCAFIGCTALETVILPKAAEISPDAFLGCDIKYADFSGLQALQQIYGIQNATVILSDEVIASYEDPQVCCRIIGCKQVMSASEAQRTQSAATAEPDDALQAQRTAATAEPINMSELQDAAAPARETMQLLQKIEQLRQQDWPLEQILHFLYASELQEAAAPARHRQTQQQPQQQQQPRAALDKLEKVSAH